MQIYSPDTCDCILNLDIIPDIDLDNSQISINDVLSKCSVHSDEDTNQDVFSAINTENNRKNRVWKNLLDNATADMVMNDAQGNLVFRDHISITWSWSGVKPDRTLTIRLLGKTLTTNQRNVVQNRLNNAFPNQNIIFVNQ